MVVDSIVVEFDEEVVRVELFSSSSSSSLKSSSHSGIESI
jgi:hypothetical protein